jgi:type II secretion system (T2SS) protein E
MARIGELLVEAGVITKVQLAEALAHQREHGGRLGTNLVELGMLDEKALAKELAKQLSIPSATAAQIDRAEAGARKLLPGKLADRLRAVPIREDAGKLWVAMADPTDQHAVNEVSKATGKKIRPMVAPELLIQYGLELHYGVQRQARVVEVRTGSSDLLQIDAPETPTVPRASAGRKAAKPPPLPPPAEEAPVWTTFGGGQPRVDVDALSGFLDERPERASSGTARMPMREVSSQLVAATSDEAIFDVALRYVAEDVSRLAVFLLRNGLLGGWRGIGIDSKMLRHINVALAEAPVVAQAMSTGETWVGRLHASDLGALAQPLGAAREALGVILPVRIGKRAVAALVGLDATLESLRRKPELDRLAVKLDQALHISYLRRLLLEP